MTIARSGKWSSTCEWFGISKKKLMNIFWSVFKN